MLSVLALPHWLVTQCVRLALPDAMHLLIIVIDWGPYL